MSTTPSAPKSPSFHVAGRPLSNLPPARKLAASRMSTFQSRFVSPGAANAKLIEPSPLSSQPTVRGIDWASAAAAAVEVMPRGPFHEPSPRPVASAERRVAGESPAVTVIMPLPTSISPPAAGTKAPMVVFSPGARVTVPPASGTSRLAARAEPCASCSLPDCTVTEPERVLAALNTSVPAPVFVTPKVPDRSG